MAEDSYLRTLEKVDISIDGVSYNLIAASFRGVPFFVDDYEQGGGGRTISTKKIPFSNEFVNEDVGGNVPTHSMTIYLVGDDCDIQKKRLLDACAKEGAAELVHPWIGRFSARCSSLSFSSSRENLGYVKGKISFVQESTLPEKSVEASLAGATKNKSKSFMEKAKESFASVISGAKKAKSFVDMVAKSTDDALDIVDNARKGLREVNAFVNEIGKIKANVEVLIMTPGDFAARIGNIVASTAEIFGLESDKKDDLDQFYNIAKNSDDSIVGRYVQGLAVGMIAASLVDAEFVSVEDAAGYQDRISSLIDSMLEKTDDIEEYMRLNDLRASALSYLRDIMQSMSVVLEKDNPGSTNILSFAFDTYGNLDKVSDIMSRNSFSQGLFILPGKVRVLSK